MNRYNEGDQSVRLPHCCSNRLQRLPSGRSPQNRQKSPLPESSEGGEAERAGKGAVGAAAEEGALGTAAADPNSRIDLKKTERVAVIVEEEAGGAVERAKGVRIGRHKDAAGQNQALGAGAACQATRRQRELSLQRGTQETLD